MTHAHDNHGHDDGHDHHDHADHDTMTTAGGHVHARADGQARLASGFPFSTM
jgi:hypothetical protein